MQRSLAAALAVASASASGLVPFNDPRTCKGYEKEYRSCDSLPACHKCEPVHCAFEEWGDWFEAGGCTGVCFRHRDIATVNNACGTPCTGLKQETKQCINAACSLVAQDCLLGDWSSWSECGEDFTAQKVRSRDVVVYPMNGGRECSDFLNETAPCGATPTVDCELTEWGDWTECSASCNGGWHSQMRRVRSRAELGGKACQGSTRRIEQCALQPCGERRDCVLGAWAAWSGCGLVGGAQRYRSREVEAPSQFGGEPCSEVLKETSGCGDNLHDPKPCSMTQWSDWAECSQSCGGGQSFRKRRLEHGSSSCGSASLHQTRPCGAEPCTSGCELSAWSAWSQCPVTCGVGVASRHRQVAGAGCSATLSEARGCRMEPCQAEDCAWADWEPWSACSCSCGGGTTRRERMIRVAPTPGGRPCEAGEKSQVAPCNTQSCSECIDGAWGDWESWSACSATCGAGFRARHRIIARHPNDCGKSAAGLEDEYETCQGGGPCEPDSDCVLSDWTGWSGCSSNCFGVSERQRQVVHFATGRGRSCSLQATKEAAQCNPGSGEALPEGCGLPSAEACMLGEWSDWGACSASCDGGQRVRERSVLSPARGGGAPCEGDLSMTAPCATQTCLGKEQDCQWGEWSDWGQCSGDQRYRHRAVMSLPNAWGKACSASAAKEVSSCNGTDHGSHFCGWSDWSAFGSCSANCGPATRIRQRAMLSFTMAPSSYLFEGPATAACGGAQLELAACEQKPCGADTAPVDCVFGFWSEWSAPTCTQLCERHRVIEQMSANLGDFCRGPLVETKRCERDCTHAQDCLLSDWGAWGHCESYESQRYRSRSVVQYAANGGLECAGNLEETASCNEAPANIVPCSFSLWSDWAACSQSCGGGLRSRERSIQGPAENGGAVCDGNLAELSVCATQECGDLPISCILGEWSAWSGCSHTADGGKSRSRERKVLREPEHGGEGCNGSLKELQSCSGVTDCQLSPWTSWDACDKTCGGGQRLRHRQVVRSPEAGGKPCSPSLMEIQGCNEATCNRRDCALDDWAAWSECSASCGSGQQSRGRKVVQLPKDGGDGCHMKLQETRACLDMHNQPLGACPTVDCIWGLWSDWSSCSSRCEGGTRTRDRHIVQAPQRGGRPCMAWSKEEAEPCNTQPCKEQWCLDGQWGVWEDWEPCSSSCNGGLTWRSRKVLVEANECGTPATGDSRVYRSCNTGVPCEPDADCQLSEWGDWSACSKSCGGVMRRSRDIAAVGHGKGASCEGDLKQTAPCGPISGEQTPEGCLMAELQADCELSSWQDWGGCSVSCGGGQQSRSRQLAAEATGGGHCPLAALAETRSCSVEACPDQCLPVDCAWNDWSAWSACDKCGGERRRFRHVQRMARCGGELCDAGLAEEVANCTRKCHEASYCVFGDWAAWGECSASCGTGLQSRERHLEVTQEPVTVLEDNSESSHFLADFQQLRMETQELQRHHMQNLMAAFATGLLSLVPGFALVRAWARKRQPDGGRDVSAFAAIVE